MDATISFFNGNSATLDRTRRRAAMQLLFAR